jgi:hypothetical protein
LSLFKMCVSCQFSTANIFLDHKMHNALGAQALSVFRLLLPSVHWRHCSVDPFVNWLFLPTRSGEKFIFIVLRIICCIDFVVGRDVGCYKIWMIWSQGVTLMSRIVHLINLNNTKSACWQSLDWKSLLLSRLGVWISLCQGQWCNLPLLPLAPLVINRPYVDVTCHITRCSRHTLGYVRTHSTSRAHATVQQVMSPLSAKCILGTGSLQECMRECEV